MVLKIPPITVCPHCGFESEDDEMCRACGELIENNIAARNVSLPHILSNNFFSWLKDKGFHGGEDNIFKVDASDDPGLAHLPGNSYHYIWLANHASHDKD